MSKPSDLVQGTLDMLLKNGFALSQRLKQVSGDVLQVSDGAGTRGLDYSRVENVRISPAGDILFADTPGSATARKRSGHLGQAFERHFAGDHA